MSPRIPSVLLFLFATASLAQTADLTIASLQADAKYNAGDATTIRVTVKNLGPDTASVAGVRLPKVAMGFVAAQQYGCIDMIDSVLCNVGALAAGESHDFIVPFLPPFVAGTMTLSPRTESFTADPNHDNDGAKVTAEVVEMADLKPRLYVYPGLQPGKVSNLNGEVENVAARTATGVHVTLSIPEGIDIDTVPPNCTRVGSNKISCSLPDLERLTGRGGFSIPVRPRADAPHQVVLSATAESDTPEWNPPDNTVTLEQGVYTLADLDVTLSAPSQQDEAGQAPVTVQLTNRGDAAAMNDAIAISVGFQTIVSWNAPGWSCKPWEPNEIRCTADSIPAHASSSIDLNVKFQSREARFGVSVNVSQTPGPNFPTTMQWFSRDVVFYRTFEVTNTNDSGPGSLRDAVERANEQCSATQGAPPCRIAFQIPAPVPPEGWFTIEPRSPLPPITVFDFLIDGGAQTASTGDTNPNGPELFLRGESAGQSEGLFIRSAIASVRGLAIGGFALNGIKVVSRENSYFYSTCRQTIEDNYLGIDPSGARAVPNGLRGLMTIAATGTIGRNVISGNVRSGIWAEHADGLIIRDNRIGVAARGEAPLPNGATGVFFLDSAAFGDNLVEHNVIAWNREYGVSSTKLSRFSLLENVVAHNGTAADLGLDGPTPDYYNGYIAPQPVLTSARYADGRTVIEGNVPTQGSYFGYSYVTTIYLYANSSLEEGGEEFLGVANMQSGGFFTLTVARDLRGKFIDATTHMVINFGEIIPRVSSEFGPPVPVTNP